MSSLVNYIQPNKFISFDNAKSGSSLKTKQDKTQVKVFKSEWPVQFFFLTHPFPPVAEKNKSYVISSFVETKGEAMISKTAVDFVEYPLSSSS